MPTPHAARRAGPTRCRRSTPTRRASRPARRPARSSPRSRRVLPELWGGSADLAESQQHHARRASRPSSRRDRVDQGVRPATGTAGCCTSASASTAMGSILNGIALHGGTRAVRRHLPGLQRLHAPGGAARGADEAAGHLRLDPRLDRPRRGRPDPPADRAPRRAAGDPRPRRRPPGRRQRDRRRLARDPRAHRPARPAWPDPAEPADLPARRRTATPTRRNVAPRRATCSLDADGGQPRRRADRHRLRGAARGRGPRAARGRRHPRPGRVDAVPGVVRRAGRSPTARPCSRRPSRRACRVEAGVAHGLARHRRRRRPSRQHRALRRVAPTTRRLFQRVRLHRRGRRRGRERQHRGCRPS